MLRDHRLRVNRLYSLTAPHYEQDIAPVLEPFARFLVEQSAVRPDQTVLDVGTGTGLTLRIVAPLARRTLGVDIVMPMLAEAQVLRRVQGWPRTHLLLADACTLDALADQSCDVVLACFGLNDCPPDRVLASLARVLRPGGTLHTLEWGPYSPHDPRLIVDDMLANHATPEPPPALSELRKMLAEPRLWDQLMQDEEDYRDALTEAGFDAVTVTEGHPATSDVTVTQFLRYALAWGPHTAELAALLPDQRTAILRQLSINLGQETRLRWQPELFYTHSVRKF